MSEYVSDPVSDEEVVAVEEPAPVEEPVAVEEVSTETVDNSKLEERVKVLEERLEKLIDVYGGWLQKYNATSMIPGCGELISSFNEL